MITWYLFALGSFAVLVAGAMLPKGAARGEPPRAQLVEPGRRLRFDRDRATRAAGRAVTAATVVVGAFMAAVLLYFVALVVAAAARGLS